jgi:hypothetical protein
LANASCVLSKAASFWVGCTRVPAAVFAEGDAVHIAANRDSNARSVSQCRLVRLVTFITAAFLLSR